MKFSRIKIILFFQYPLLIDWVGEWLLLNANSAIFQLYYANYAPLLSNLFYTPMSLSLYKNKYKDKKK
jgi:hypothetical protein